MRGVAQLDNFSNEPKRSAQRKNFPFPIRLVTAFADWFDKRGTYVPNEANEPLISQSSVLLYLIWWLTFCALVLLITVAFH